MSRPVTRSAPVRRRRSVVLVVVGLVLGLVASACSGGDGGRGGSGEGQALRLTALSTRPEYVTNGDVLVGIDSPTGQPLEGVTVDLGGRDVTEVFGLDVAPHRAPGSPTRLVGLVSGLTAGENRITARMGDAKAELTVTDHPVDGPLFSGPQQSPFVCTTGRSGLGPPEDDCWARTQVRWMYRAADGHLADLVDPASTPADASTIEVGGQTVPFVVRVEKGVFNRSITTFAVLDPRPGAPAGTTPGPTPVRAWDDSAWNGRLVFRFGGGCGATYSQGDDVMGAVEPNLLAEGYAVIASSLTTFATACNDVVSAETAMVAKEHFSEAYGLPQYTIGEGGSGGAIQQLLVAQNYPGLLDAVAPSIPFPDAVSIAGGVADCGLLGRFFAESPEDGAAAAGAAASSGGGAWSEPQRLAVSGFASSFTCGLWRASYLENIRPSMGCARELVDAGQVYDPATNPRGVRCTFQDSNVNELGTDGSTGFALRPLDNVGVQYGLEALRAGTITPDQFLDLNDQIGGYDIDGRWQPERVRADDEVLDRAYEGGRITAGSALGDAGALSVDGAGGLVDVPVLLIDLYTDPLGDIHDRQRIFAIADRLALPDGSANPNVARWTIPGPTDLQSLMVAATGNTGTTVAAVRALDEWLTAADARAAAEGQIVPRVGDLAGTGATAAGNPLASFGAAPDGSPLPTARAALLASTRPAGAADRCSFGGGDVVTGPESYAPGSRCDQAYPTHGDPRQAAGAPQAGTTIACTLVPVDPSSSAYGVAFTDAQAERLRRIFPDGVCDWTQPGRGQSPLTGTWQTWPR